MKLTRNTTIRLSQIKDLIIFVEDADNLPPRQWKDGLMHEKVNGTWRICNKKDTEKKEWSVPRSLGARAVTYTAKADFDVKMRDKNFILKEGSKVTDIELIARGNGIKKVQSLINDYPRQDGSKTTASDWTKKKGNGTVVDSEGKQRDAELHWYECKGLGKKKFKVKKWLRK